MNIIVLIAVVLSSVVLTIMAIVALRVWWLTKPTKGKSITADDKGKTALIIIDIQNDTINRNPYFNKEAALKNIRYCIETADNKKYEIVYIKQEYSYILDILITAGMYKKSGTGSDISKQIKVKSKNVFTKTRSDSFSSELFSDFLINKNVKNLYLIGADLSACVYKTALAAKNRGYNVTVLEDAVFSRTEGIRDAMLEKYKANNINIGSVNDF